MSSFQARSVRIGELRLDDLIHIVRDVRSLTVLAINDQGVPVIVNVAMTEKWSGNGWTRAFACPLCCSPARVLSIRTNAAACGRCERRPTLQARNKNRVDWAEARLADTLARGLLGIRTLAPASARATARALRRRSLAHASACFDLAVGAIRVADEALKERHG